MKHSTAFIMLVLICIPCSVHCWPIPHSGQMQCYDNEKEIQCPVSSQPFYGQNSHFIINPRSFTKLDIQANELPDDATDWQMVKDNVTGLIWEVKHAKDDRVDYNNPNDFDNTYAWYSFLSAGSDDYTESYNSGVNTTLFIDQMNRNEFGGFNDWRLPSIKELSTISNFGMKYPALDDIYFNNNINELYWTTTSYISRDNHVWTVQMNNGDCCDTSKSQKCYVRAVRGNQERPFDHWIINTDNTFTDTQTGLMWQLEIPSQKKNWESALSYCTDLTLANYSDWRLPSRNELMSIADFTKEQPASDHFWSSTTYQNIPYFAWTLKLSNGSDEFSDKTNQNAVRAVRGGQIQLEDRLTIDFPRQSSLLITGNKVQISWQTATIDSCVSILLSRQGGIAESFVTLVQETENDGSYEWQVDGFPSANCVLKIETLSSPKQSTQQGLFIIKHSDIDIHSNINTVLTITGPENYTGFGKSLTIDNAYPGQYTISYADQTCWQTPAPESQTLTWWGSLSFSGNYQESLPKPVQNLRANYAIKTYIGNNQITTQWQPVDQCLKGYVFVWDQHENTIPDNAISSQSDQTISHPLANGNDHWFHIKSINIHGKASQTTHLGPFYIDTSLRPPAPQSLSVIPSEISHCIALKWDYTITDTIKSYNIYRSGAENGDYIKINALPVNHPVYLNDRWFQTYTDSELTNHVEYWYTVKAVDQNFEESDFSQCVKAISQALPDGDFRIVIPYTSRWVVTGDTTIIQIMIISEDNFNEVVRLSATSTFLPTQVTRILDKTTIDPTGSTLLHVKVPYSTNTGTYAIKVNAISENRSHDATIDLNIIKPGNGESVLTILGNNQPVNIGDSIDLYGQLLPLQIEGTMINVLIQPPDKEWIQYSTEINALGEYYFEYRPESPGEYQVKVEWMGTENFDAIESQEKTFHVGLGKSNIWCSTPTKDIEFGNAVDIQITVNPPLSIPFDLKIEKPGLESPEYIRSLVTQSDGKRVLTFILDGNQQGIWKFQALWYGNQHYTGSVSTPLFLYPETDVAQALIIAGGGIPQNTLWKTTEYLCNRFYEILKKRRFTHDQIMYITDHTYHYDIDGDGINEYEVDDNTPSVDEISWYLSQLYAHEGSSKVNSNISLIIYMADHGGTGTFKVNSGEYLSAETMDQWLDTLQEHTDCLVMVIVEACHSGTFIDKLHPSDNQRRILISSSDTEESQYDNEGQLSFSRYLFDSILIGKNLLESFHKGCFEISNHYLFTKQKPQLRGDDLASDFYIGGTAITGDINPEILSFTRNQVISAGNFNVFVEAYDDIALDRVWVSIIQPDTIIPTSNKDFETPLINSQQLKLVNSTNDHIFNGQYDFKCNGNYILTFFVRDSGGNIKTSESQLNVIKGIRCTPGDIDTNGISDLRDIVLGLKIISHMEIDQEISLQGDICGNARIGLEEIIYGFQQIICHQF